MTTIIIREERQRQHALETIGRLAAGKVWEVKIGRHVKKRALNANALYWKWIQIIADDTGNDAEDIHSFFKEKFLAPVMIDVGGELGEVRPSTAALSVPDFSIFMTKVEQFSIAELGISLPHPEDLGRSPS